MASDLLENIKDELAFTLNTMLSTNNIVLRQAARRLDGATPSLLSRVNNYKLDGVTAERLFRLVSEVELLTTGSATGFEIDVCEVSRTISISFLGLCANPPHHRRTCA